MIFSSQSEFSTYVEHLVKLNDCTHLEAVMTLMESEGMDEESVAKLVSPALKQRLELCYQELNMLPSPSSTLQEFESNVVIE